MKSNIDALRQRKITINGKLQALHAKTITGNGARDFTLEEAAQWEELKAEQSANEAALIREEAALEQARKAPAVPVPTSGFGEWTPYRAASGNQGNYADLFGKSGDTGGFTSIGEFMQAVHNAHQFPDPRLKSAIMASQVEGIPSAGGFLVPEQFSADLFTKALENSIVMPNCQVVPMTSDTKKIAGLDDSDHTNGNLYGGIVATWTPELSPLDEKSAKTRLIELHANKLAVLANVSNELLEDGQNFDTLYSDALQGAVAWHLDSAFLTASGAGRPKGILNDPALITVAKDSGDTGADFSYADATAMLARLHPACFNSSTWIVNNTVLPKLYAMAKNTAGVLGTVTTPTFAQLPSGQFTLFGRPVLLTEKTPVLGTPGDVILADLTQYTVGLRRGISIERSMHAGFSTDSVWYRCIVRCDGQGRWKSALTPLHGSTLSWCVALAVRS